LNTAAQAAIKKTAESMPDDEVLPQEFPSKVNINVTEATRYSSNLPGQELKDI